MAKRVKKAAVKVRRARTAKEIRTVTAAKAWRAFGENALKIISVPKGIDTARPARSLMLEFLQGLARGMPVSGLPWDDKVVQKGAREVLTLVGELP